MGKKNCIAKEAYTKWVKDKVSEILLPLSPEPSMSIKPLEPVIHQTSAVDELKRVIKALEKENANLKSRLGKISLEKETLKFNLNQKIDRVSQEDDEVQTEVFKRIKVGDTLKWTYASLTVKKKQLVETQYQACKAELNYREQAKKLRDLLKACKKEMKNEQSRTKQLEVTLHLNQYELGQRLEEIRELKEQSHKNLEDTKFSDLLWGVVVKMFLNIAL